MPYILLADDDPDDLDTFTCAFTRLNPNAFVETVNDGKELFELLGACNPQELPILILMDYKMPLITGPEILQKLASSTTYSHIPKLIWSTSERYKDIELCRRLGADNYFKKPATSSEIDDLVRQVDMIFTIQLKNLNS